MGWDTNLNPKKLPQMQGRGIDPPALSMDEYVRFCARMRIETAKNVLSLPISLEEGLPVKALFRVVGNP